MEHHFSTSASSYPFEKYFTDYNVSVETKKKLDSSDILVLPTPYENSEFYFAQEAVSFVKYCRTANKDIKADILADNDRIEIRSLHSFDIWMPVIMVASNIVLQIAIGLITNYLYDRMKGRETEDCQTRVTLIVKDGDKIIDLHYEGKAADFQKEFEKIDIHKL